MARSGMICALIILVSIHSILAIEDNDVDYQNEKNVRVVGRAYSLTGCSYDSQAGYTCLSCHRALHCYIGGAAIMVDCYGLFRYCRDGHCSRRQGAKCFEDTKLTTSSPGLFNVTAAHVSVPENHASVIENQASVIENQASVIENQAGVIENQAGVIENQASVIEKQSNVVEKSVIENHISVVENETS